MTQPLLTDAFKRSYLTGVIGVSNLIAVKPHVSPTEIKSKIERRA